MTKGCFGLLKNNKLTIYNNCQNYINERLGNEYMFRMLFNYERIIENLSIDEIFAQKLLNKEDRINYSNYLLNKSDII